MNATLRAAILSALIVGAASLALYYKTPQGIAALIYIVVMVPLWAVDNLGVIDVGIGKNGFFLPSPAGYAVGAVMFWLVILVLFRLLWPGRSR